MTDKPTIYNIPAGVAFANTFARGLMATHGADPALLSATRLFLPTRRACRNLREAFLRLSEGRPLLLPRMQPLGDIDEDELSMALTGQENAALLLDLPPVISPTRRQILLARTILKLPDFTHSPDQAFQLATTLGRLMDQIYTEGRDMGALATLVPDEFAAHWHITLDFLKILSEAWPHILAEHGVIDAADRRNRLMAALVRHWQDNPPDTPIIAAGSTGSIPATAALLKTIAHLPRGAVVLPGLDQEMDEESWRSIDDTHPQATLKQLLNHMDVTRPAVQQWPGLSPDQTDQPLSVARRWLARETMRPMETAERWQNLNLNTQQQDRLRRSLDQIMRFDCATVQEEAELIALLMRETLESGATKTATLVTPDRTLARRVAMACRRWGIEIDDSGGQNLADTPQGSFLRLVLTTAHEHMRPSLLLSLLKHRFFSAGGDQALIEALEIKLLRGPMLPGGLSGLKQRAAKDESAATLIPLIETIDKIFAPLCALCDGQRHDFKILLDTHLRFAESLGDPAKLWQGDNGEEAAQFWAELRSHAADMTPMTLHDYLTITSQMMSARMVRPAYGTHPRLSILGQLEARLLQADRVILGGLNEKTWPPEPAADPWLSRPMKKEFGLPSPERMIGLAAHDFVQGFCAPHVVLTRARRVDGTPTVPARWLQRLDTVLQAIGQEPEQLHAHPYLKYTRRLDQVETVIPCARPAPCPPRAARPRALYVTAIERWMRDPYSLYARDILKLKPLDPLEQEADLALRGTLIHDVLDQFIRAYPDNLPADALEQLLALGRREITETYGDDPALNGLWWNRFERLARWFIEHETEWRIMARPLATECKGSLTLPDVDFTVNAKADRIDRLRANGAIALIDYKTGSTPSPKDIENGTAPQMPLEALILREGGFDAAPLPNEHTHNAVDYMAFWKINGGQKPGDEITIKGDNYNALMTQAYNGLSALVKAFDHDETPYYSLPRPDKAPPVARQDYAHLARVQEWAALGDNDGEG